MTSLSAIEQIRLQHLPTLTTAQFSVPVASSHGGLFENAKIYFEWFENRPFNLVMVFPPQPGTNGETIVWEFPRLLAHYALVYPGHEFGLGDVTVMAPTRTWLLVTLRDPETGSWYAYDIPAGSLADLMHRTNKISPLPKAHGPLPYARRRP